MNWAASISYEPQIIHVMTSDRNICYEHALSIQRDCFWRACASPLSLYLCRYKVGHFLSLFLLSLKLSSKGYSQLLVMIFRCLITILTTTHCFNFLPIF